MQKAGSPLQPLSSGVVHIHAHAHTHLTLPCTTSSFPPAWGKGWVPTSQTASPKHRKTYEGLRLTWDSP